MDVLIQIAIALLAVWGVVWFLRRMFHFRATLEEEITHGGDEGGSDPAKVTARLKRGPRAGAGAVALPEPDEEPDDELESFRKPVSRRAR
jgi:hypothetical protein